MLEKEMIQSRGFKNVHRDGKIVGFQVAFRTTYYRGVYLSQLGEATMTVDGEKFSGNQITWTIGGRTYAQTDLEKWSDVHWQYLEPAVLTVSRPGGLRPGLHEVEVTYQYSASYMPPAMDPRTVTGRRKMVLVV
jgi:hypothetical protein